jgi:hypothetical protein
MAFRGCNMDGRLAACVFCIDIPAEVFYYRDYLYITRLSRMMHRSPTISVFHGDISRKVFQSPDKVCTAIRSRNKHLPYLLRIVV